MAKSYTLPTADELNKEFGVEVLTSGMEVSEAGVRLCLVLLERIEAQERELDTLRNKVRELEPPSRAGSHSS